MQRLKVSGAVRLIYKSLGVKGLIYRPGDGLRARDKSEVSRLLGYIAVSIGKLLRFGGASCLHPHGLISTLGLIISRIVCRKK
jgi:hypothetical protein